MFDIGFAEFLALGVLALLVFGPDRLPKIAADAGRMLRQLRAMARNAREELGGALGSEFDDLGLKDLNPREFVKRQLLDETADIEQTIKDVQRAVKNGTDEPAPNGSGPSSNGATPKSPASEPSHRDDGDAT